MNIGGKQIGYNEPIFLCAECAVTADGYEKKAKRLIDAAKQAGADAIKFMFTDPNEILSDKEQTYSWQEVDGEHTGFIHDILEKCMFTEGQWRNIVDYAKQKDIILFASIDNIKDIALAEELGVPAYKVSCWDLRNYPLLIALAKTGKPLLIDTGPAIDGELFQVIDCIKRNGCKDYMIVHESHAKDASGINLLSIPYLFERTGRPVGWSADGREVIPDIMAVPLGARYIEKRLTLDVNTEGHHHSKSLEPDEFTEWVKQIKQAEQLLGEWGLFPSKEDIAQKVEHLTSLVFERDVKAGEIITEDMLGARRPGRGLSPYYSYLFLGKPAARDFMAGEVLDYDSI